MANPAPASAAFALTDAINRVREITDDRESAPANRASHLVLSEIVELADIALVLAPHAARLLAEVEILRRQMKEHRC